MSSLNLLWLLLSCDAPDDKPGGGETADTGELPWETPCAPLTGLRREGTRWSYAHSADAGDHTADMALTAADGASITVTEDWTWRPSGGSTSAWQVVQDYQCDADGLSQRGFTIADRQTLYEPPRLLVPAEVAEGTSWQIRTDVTNLESGSVLSTTTETWSCEAGAREQRTVPAGVFDAMQLRCDSEGDSFTIGWLSDGVGVIEGDNLLLASHTP